MSHHDTSQSAATSITPSRRKSIRLAPQQTEYGPNIKPCSTKTPITTSSNSLSDSPASNNLVAVTTQPQSNIFNDQVSSPASVGRGMTTLPDEFDVNSPRSPLYPVHSSAVLAQAKRTTAAQAHAQQDLHLEGVFEMIGSQDMSESHVSLIGAHGEWVSPDRRIASTTASWAVGSPILLSPLRKSTHAFSPTARSQVVAFASPSSRAHTRPVAFSPRSPTRPVAMLASTSSSASSYAPALPVNPVTPVLHDAPAPAPAALPAVVQSPPAASGPITSACSPAPAHARAIPMRPSRRYATTDLIALPHSPADSGCSVETLLFAGHTAGDAACDVAHATSQATNAAHSIPPASPRIGPPTPGTRASALSAGSPAAPPAATPSHTHVPRSPDTPVRSSPGACSAAYPLATSAWSTVPVDSPPSPAAQPRTPAPAMSFRRSPYSATLSAALSPTFSVATTAASAVRARRRRVMASAAVVATPRARMPAGLPASLALLKRMAGISPMRAHQPHAPSHALATSPRPVARIADSQLAGGVRATLGYFSRPQYGGYIAAHAHTPLPAAATPFAASDAARTPAPPSTARPPSTASARRRTTSTRARTAALPAASSAATYEALPAPASPISEYFHTPSGRATVPPARGLASRILSTARTAATTAATPALALALGAAHASLPQLAVARSPGTIGAATPVRSVQQQAPQSRPHTRSQRLVPARVATTPAPAQTPVTTADSALAASPAGTLTPNSFADAARARQRPTRLLAGTPVAHAGVGAAYSALAGDGLDAGVWGVRAWGVGRWGTLSVAASHEDTRTRALSSPRDGTERPSPSPPLLRTSPRDDHTAVVRASTSTPAAPRRRSLPVLPGLAAFAHPSPLSDPVATPPFSAGALAHSPAASAASARAGVPLTRSTSLQLAARAALRLASFRRAREQSAMASMYQDLYSAPSVHHGSLPRARAEESPVALLQWLSAEAMGDVTAAKEHPISAGAALRVGVAPTAAASPQEAAGASPDPAPHWTMPPPAPRAPTPTHQKAGAGGWPRRRVPDAPVGDSGAAATALPLGVDADVGAVAVSAGSSATPDPRAPRSKRKSPVTDAPPLPPHQGAPTQTPHARAAPSPTSAHSPHPHTTTLPATPRLPAHSPASARAHAPPVGDTDSASPAPSPDTAHAAASTPAKQHTRLPSPTDSPARATPAAISLAPIAARRLRAALTIAVPGHATSPAGDSPPPAPAATPAEAAVDASMDTCGVDARASKRTRSCAPATAAEEPRAGRTERVQLALPVSPPATATAAARERHLHAPVRAPAAPAPTQSSLPAHAAAHAGSSTAAAVVLAPTRTPATGLSRATAPASSRAAAAPARGAVPSRLTALLARRAAAAGRASPRTQVIPGKRRRTGRAATRQPCEPRQPHQPHSATPAPHAPCAAAPVVGCPQGGVPATSIPRSDAQVASGADAPLVPAFPAPLSPLAAVSSTSPRHVSPSSAAAGVSSRLRGPQLYRACSTSSSTSPIRAIAGTDGIAFNSHPRARLSFPRTPASPLAPAPSTPRALAVSTASPPRARCAPCLVSSSSRSSAPAEDATVDTGVAAEEEEEEEWSEELIFLQLLRSALRTNAKLLFWRQSAQAHARIAERLREERAEEAQRRARELRAVDAVRRAEQQLWCLRGEESAHAASARVQAACVRECADGLREAHEAAARLVAAERERCLMLGSPLAPLAHRTRADAPPGLPEGDAAASAEVSPGPCTPSRTLPRPADEPTLVLPCGARVGATDHVCHHVHHHCHCTCARTEHAVATVLSPPPLPPQTPPPVAAAQDKDAIASVGVVAALADPDHAAASSSSPPRGGLPAHAPSTPRPSLTASVPSMHTRTPPSPPSSPDAFAFPATPRAPPHTDAVLRRKRRMPGAHLPVPNTAPALRRRAISASAAAASMRGPERVELAPLSQQAATASAPVAVAPLSSAPPRVSSTPPTAPVVYRVDGRRRTALRHSVQLAAYDRKHHHALAVGTCLTAALPEARLLGPEPSYSGAAASSSTRVPSPSVASSTLPPAMDPALATLFASDSWRAVVAAAEPLLSTETVSRLREGYAAEVTELLSRRERASVFGGSGKRHASLQSGDVIDLGAGAIVQAVRAELRDACRLDKSAHIRVRMAAEAMIRWEAALKSTLRECLE